MTWKSEGVTGRLSEHSPRPSRKRLATSEKQFEVRLPSAQATPPGPQLPPAIELAAGLFDGTVFLYFSPCDSLYCNPAPLVGGSLLS